MGKRRKGKGRNAYYKNLVFCITPTNFLIIRLRILSIYCQSVHQSERSARPVPLRYAGIFVCQREYLLSLEKGFCIQPIGGSYCRRPSPSLPNPLPFSLSHYPPLLKLATQATTDTSMLYFFKSKCNRCMPILSYFPQNCLPSI